MYAKITESGATPLTVGVAVEWDSANYCTPEALVKDGKAEQFGVVDLHPSPLPTHDPKTHAVVADGCELVNGLWHEKWVIVPLPADVARQNAKLARQAAVDNIKVTTAAGHTFDGDEMSQTRMARAVLVLSTGVAQTVSWVLADNTVIQADAAELSEALALAGAAQAALWVI